VEQLWRVQVVGKHLELWVSKMWRVSEVALRGSGVYQRSHCVAVASSEFCVVSCSLKNVV